MSLTNVAMLGILMGLVFLVVGFLMEGPQAGAEPAWNRAKHVHKKTKRRIGRVPHLHRHAA